jgi:hypothetical protein
MEGSAELYEDLIALLRNTTALRDVAAQIEEEIARAAPTWTRVGSTNRDYSGDERLEILIGALHTLAYSMQQSRAAVAGLADRVDAASITFSDLADGGRHWEESIPLLTDQAHQLSGVTQALSEALDAVRLS